MHVSCSLWSEGRGIISFIYIYSQNVEYSGQLVLPFFGLSFQLSWSLHIIVCCCFCFAAVVFAAVVNFYTKFICVMLQNQC